MQEGTPGNYSSFRQEVTESQYSSDQSEISEYQEEDELVEDPEEYAYSEEAYHGQPSTSGQIRRHDDGSHQTYPEYLGDSTRSDPGRGGYHYRQDDSAPMPSQPYEMPTHQQQTGYVYHQSYGWQPGYMTVGPAGLVGGGGANPPGNAPQPYADPRMQVSAGAGAARQGLGTESREAYAAPKFVPEGSGGHDKAYQTYPPVRHLLPASAPAASLSRSTTMTPPVREYPSLAGVITASGDSLGQRPPPDARSRVTTEAWEEESTLCIVVEAEGTMITRRCDNNMINGTKLLNVIGMTRGRRDGLLKSEKVRHVVKIGSMHLKGVWIPYERALKIADQQHKVDSLYPLFVANLEDFLYHPQNHTRTLQVVRTAESKNPAFKDWENGIPRPLARQAAQEQQQQQHQQHQQHHQPQPGPSTQPATSAGASYGHHQYPSEDYGARVAHPSQQHAPPITPYGASMYPVAPSYASAPQQPAMKYEEDYGRPENPSYRYEYSAGYDPGHSHSSREIYDTAYYYPEQYMPRGYSHIASMPGPAQPQHQQLQHQQQHQQQHQPQPQQHQQQHQPAHQRSQSDVAPSDHPHRASQAPNQPRMPQHPRRQG